MNVLFPIHQDPRAGDDPPAGETPPETILGADGGENPQPFAVPDKFMVKGADDQPDYKQIVEKLGQSYSHLEKRLGTGDIPPKTADEYKLEKYLPDGMEANQEALKPILGSFHKLGLTQGQVQGVMSVFGEQLAAGQVAEKAAFDSGIAALKTAWGDKYELQIANAKSGLAAYTAQDKELAAILATPKYANDPAIIKLLAIVGADLNEDTPPNELDGAAAESIDELRKSKAYLDPKDPGHADAVRKVNDAYTKGYKANRS
jgi:hypothetical protein